MTWNDLIDRLNQIPENRREEKAIFSHEDCDWEIDDCGLVSLLSLETDARADGQDEVYVLTP